MSFEEFLPYRLQIGYGFDFGGLLHNKTLLENLTLPLTYHKICNEGEAQDRVHYYLSELNALKFANKKPSEIPGGMRKLACVIRAIVTEPQILLLDDPSVGVGQDTILKFFDLVSELRKKDKCQHVFISSFDDKLMNCLEHSEIFIDCGQIYSEMTETEKKVVNL
jgi:ABC-type transporter Mla maintaining outer membrane lipid asymmetry ATPase subunit MlaF